jgi:hypothetical protein
MSGWHAVRSKLPLSVLATAGAMLVGMTLFENIKDHAYPGMSLWESHLITIGFSTACATLVAWLIRRHHRRLTASLMEANHAGEQLRDDLQATVNELQETLSTVRTLSGLLPICSACKKIRDDRGYWTQIETYIHEHAEVAFSHGICPDCARKLYPDDADAILGRPQSH